VTGATVTGNEAGTGSGIFNWDNYGDPSVVSCERVLLYGNIGSSALSDAGGVFYCSCTNIFGNPEGNWTGVLSELLGQDGNIAVDPEFCSTDPSADENWDLQSDSPCLGENNAECEDIGARGAGCNDTPVSGASWGRIKILFRPERQ